MKKIFRQPNARLFHCYRTDHIFTIATAFKVQEFDFFSIDSEKEIARLVRIVMEILREKVDKEYFLADEVCNS